MVLQVQQAEMAPEARVIFLRVEKNAFAARGIGIGPEIGGVRDPLFLVDDEVVHDVEIFGFGASFVQQERLMALTPLELSGHALGLHSAGMLTMQGVSAALAGGVAQLTSPATAMTVMALTSIAVTLTLKAAARNEAVREAHDYDPVSKG